MLDHSETTALWKRQDLSCVIMFPWYAISKLWLKFSPSWNSRRNISQRNRRIRHEETGADRVIASGAITRHSKPRKGCRRSQRQQTFTSTLLRSLCLLCQSGDWTRPVNLTTNTIARYIWATGEPSAILQQIVPSPFVIPDQCATTATSTIMLSSQIQCRKILTIYPGFPRTIRFMGYPAASHTLFLMILSIAGCILRTWSELRSCRLNWTIRINQSRGVCLQL